MATRARTDFISGDKAKDEAGTQFARFQKSASSSEPFNNTHIALQVLIYFIWLGEETVSPCAPQDLDVSGSIERDATNARERDYIPSQGNNPLTLPEFNVPLPVLQIDDSYVLLWIILFISMKKYPDFFSLERI